MIERLKMQLFKKTLPMADVIVEIQFFNFFGQLRFIGVTKLIELNKKKNPAKGVHS